ncbi:MULTISPECIES: hypothetical protein [Bacillaceae]|uniref:hypothetical protein n=1 Tax=Bacillaceae TaxID=186817 RepID=UPI00197B57D2|nr:MULTISPECIES: hypothetical protein [Bacillaceae]
MKMKLKVICIWNLEHRSICHSRIPVFDYYLLKEKEKNKQQIILFAAPEESVAQYADLLEEAKLSPQSADISALALYRYFFHSNKVEADENIMLVEIDH